MGGIDTWIQGIKDKVFGRFQVSRQVSVVLSLVLRRLVAKHHRNINRILGMITAVPENDCRRGFYLAGDCIGGVKSIGKADGGYISGT